MHFDRDELGHLALALQAFGWPLPLGWRIGLALFLWFSTD
jgi:hypothetical protein